jgi:hypothetical protein
VNKIDKSNKSGSKKKSGSYSRDSSIKKLKRAKVASPFRSQNTNPNNAMNHDLGSIISPKSPLTQNLDSGNKLMPALIDRTRLPKLNI